MPAEPTALDATRTPIALVSKVAIASLLLIAVAALVPPLTLARHAIPLGYNEGWNALFAGLATSGRGLYPDGTFLTNNYPPLGFFVLAWVTPIFGDAILAGRAVALAGQAVVAINVARWIAGSGSPWPMAGIGALLFVVISSLFAPSYVAASDPQWLAHALQTTALVAAWRRPDDRRTIVWTTVLLAVAGLVKHLLLPLPIALGLWQWRRSREAGRTWLATGVACLLTGFALMAAYYGRPFFDGLLLPRRLDEFFVPALRYTLFYLGPIAVVALVGNRRTPRRAFVMFYLVAAWAVGILAIVGEGVAQNAFFDAIIAMSMGAAVAVDDISRSAGRAWRPKLASICLLGLTAYLAVRAVRDLPDQLPGLENLAGRQHDAAMAVTTLRNAAPGPVACETLSLCYWSDRTSTVDFFTYGQKIWAGRVPESSCVDLFSRGGVTVLQLESDRTPYGSDRLPDACNTAIRRHYKPLFAAPSTGVVLAYDPGKAGQ